jgi:hypothetical protein
VIRRRLGLLFAAFVTPSLGILVILFAVGRVMIRYILEAGPNGATVDPVALYHSMGVAAKVGVFASFLFCAGAVQGVAASGMALITWEDCEGRPVTAAELGAATGRRLLTLLVLGFIIVAGTFIGTTFFILPGLIIAALTSFAIPAATVENLGPLAALKRGYHLRRGRTLQLIGILAIAMFALLFCQILLGLSFTLVPTSLWYVGLIAFFAAAATVAVFLFVTLTLLYRKARLERIG